MHLFIMNILESGFKFQLNQTDLPLPWCECPVENCPSTTLTRVARLTINAVINTCPVIFVSSYGSV